MMERLLARAQKLAIEAERRLVERLKTRLDGLPDASVVEVEGSRIAIGGRAILKRRLIDPAVRFITDQLT